VVDALFKQDLLLKVAAIIGAHGAEIAFPIRTLHIEPVAGKVQAANQGQPFSGRRRVFAARSKRLARLSFNC
jgi:hypothetical protein